MEEWKEYKLGEITNMKNGKKRPQNNGVFPVYGGNGIMDYSDSYNAENAIIVGRVGAYCGCVYKCESKCWVSDNAISIFAKDIADTQFLYYLMTTLDFHHHHIGGAQPLMTQDIIGDFTVSIPPLSIQHQIIQVLKSLDDKIEVNKRINDNLERQAQALFKSWFVDFEPFKKGKFIDSELGMIPEGWQVEELGNITNSITEKAGNRTDVKVLSPVNTGELLLSEEYFTKQVYSKNLAKYIMVAPNDFAYNPARINIGSIGMNTFDFSGCVSPVYVVFRCEKGYHHFFNIFKTTKNFKEEVNTRAIGGVRQTLSYKDFSLIKIVYPPKEVVEQFNRIYSHIMTLIKKNVLENKRLHQTRDTLLPKLMSGELKINDINN